MTQPKLTPAQTKAAVSSAGKNTALLSGAGCGKTFVLARRFTELLMRYPNANDPQAMANAMGRFVALTFTDKAAMEMAQRVRSMLRDRANQAGSDADRKLLLTWLDAACEARISTIHSFCASVLRSCAIQAGLDPAFTVCAETAVTDRMLAEATEEAILATLESGDADTARLLSESNFTRLGELVRKLVQQRTHCDLTAYNDPAKTLNRWRNRLQAERQAAQSRLREDATLTHLASKLESYTCSDPNDKLFAFVASAQAALQTIYTKPLEQCSDAFAEIAASSKCGNVGSKTAWSAPPIEIRATLKSLAAAVEDYAPLAEDFSDIDEQAAAAIATLTKLATAANELYRQAKRSRSFLDFDDLILSTYNLVRTNEVLRKKLSAGVDQLLIDEAQDTDATQIRLLLSLLDAEVSVAGVSPARNEGILPSKIPNFAAQRAADTRGQDARDTCAPLLPEGKLFLVGDAKQSIYRFRGAQVEVFEKLCSTLGESRRVDLDISFRTHEAGIEFVNDVFAPLMGDAYTPIEAHRTITPDHPSVEILLAQPGDSDGNTGEFESADDAAAAQAALSAQRIAEMIHGGEKLVWDAAANTYRAVRPGDIAILFTRMTKSLLFERELQKRGLPYYVVAGSGFFHQQEIHDVLNTLQAVDNPFDDLAVIGTLRSAMFALTDDTLLHLAQTHKPPYLPNLDPETLAGKIDEQQLESLRFAQLLLTRLSAQKDAMGVDELLQRLLDETGYLAALLSQPQGRRMAGNVKLLLDQARSAAAQMSLADFLAEMNEQILSESRFEQASVAGEDEDVIRLMTIHKAKGLEFPVVFVPDLNRGRRGPTDPILTRLDWGLTSKLTFSPALDENDNNDEVFDNVFDNVFDKKSVPLAHRLATAAEARDQARETIRNYYVALTRHEDHLVLVGADLRDKEGRFKDTGSFLSQLDDVLHLRERLDAGDASLPYADKKFSALLRRETPKAPKNVPTTQSPQPTNIKKIDTPLLGSLPESLGRVELAVTALSDFEHCPAAYHWRYELQCSNCGLRTFSKNADCGLKKQQKPDSLPSSQSEIRNLKSEIDIPKSEIHNPQSAMSPALLGTLLHRCLELFNFKHPQPAESLVAQVLAERDDLPPISAEELTAQLQTMLATFQSQPIATDIAGATETYRELDFLLRAGRATLRGQIDLLFRDAAGAWRIVDYKSDRVETAEDMDHKLKHYELQLLTYACAVSRFAGSPPADAGLYFLRTGETRGIIVSPEILTAAEKRIEILSNNLIHARRADNFPACGKESCYFCRNS